MGSKQSINTRLVIHQHTRVLETWVYGYMGGFEKLIVDYLRAAARKATNGKTVTFFLSGAFGPGF